MKKAAKYGPLREKFSGRGVARIGLISADMATTYLRDTDTPRNDYKQLIPGEHCALNVPFAVTVPVPPEGSVAVNVKEPRTDDGDELVMTSWPDVELNIRIVPPVV
jgi:hypothetical protein